VVTEGAQRAAHEAPYVLVIDIGSSAIKAGLYDARAEAVEGAAARIPHTVRLRSDGTAEEPVDELGAAVAQAVDAVLVRAGALAAEIGAVGADSMASTILALDRAGRPVTPVYTYADTRSGPDVEALRRDLDLSAVYDRTGCPQHTSYVPGRVRWLRRTQPSLADAVARWTDISTFLYSQWFGRSDVPSSYSVASWSGILDRHRLDWDSALLDHLSLRDDMLPPLAPYSDAISGLCTEYARRWPALANVPFFLAVGDGASANVGTGCVSPSRMALTVGTTAAMRVLVEGPGPPVPVGLWAYRLGRDATLLGGSFTEGGSVLTWSMDTLRLPAAGELDDALSRLPPDGHGLTVLPFITGERSTGWSTEATGTVRGIRASTTPLELVQAFMEAVAYRFGLVAELLVPCLGTEPQIVAGGGAIHHSPYWVQMMADVLQRPVHVSGEAEDTSRGTAALALHAMGAWSARDAVPAGIVSSREPDATRAGLYRSAMERQRAFYASTLGPPGIA